MKIVITGGSGFIGTNLMSDLINEGHSLINIDLAEPKISSHLVFWQQINILDYSSLEQSILEFEPDVIIHLAAVTDLDGKNISYYKTNIEGTKNIMDIAARSTSLKKVVYTSSMYVCKPGFIPNDYDTYRPHTIYGKSKALGEQLVKGIKCSHYKWVIIRPTSIWGPWFNIPYIDFFKTIYQGRYFDFGSACIKTYGYVGNTIQQIKQLAFSENVHAKVFYLGDYPPTHISEWATEISQRMGKGRIKVAPYIILRSAATIGDFLSVFKIKFPLTSFRLENMSTNNILPLEELYEITGPPEITRIKGIEKTLQWLEKFKGYKIKTQKGVR